MNFDFFSPFNPTGGLHYHLRAALHKKRWRPFCDTVAHWLAEWHCEAGLDGVAVGGRSSSLGGQKAAVAELVIVGPNAGYTLPEEFISRFQSVILVEPDPLAFLFFRSRFIACPARIKWVPQDYFGLNDGAIRLDQLFASYTGAAFLFSNVLGQLPILLKKNKKIDVEAYMKNLGGVLQKAVLEKQVASYHDRYSRSLLKSDEVIDHLTGELFAVKNSRVVKREFPWRITPSIEHQVEFVYAKK